MLFFYKLIIQKTKYTNPTEKNKILYKIKLKELRRIKIFNNHFYIKMSNLFYGNFFPETIHLAKTAKVPINNRKVKVLSDTVLHYYKNGKFKSGLFPGLLQYKYKGKIIYLYNDISFYKNSKLKEGILAKSISLSIWGKKIKIPKDATLHFTKRGTLQTYTFYDSKNNLRIIFVPEFKDKD